MYETLTGLGHSVALCAPTGKAARRIKDITGIPAVTIHKLLEYPRPGERDEKGKPLHSGVPKRGKDAPIDYNVIIVDEYAMVNEGLNRNLMDAIPRGGVIRVFGDVHQLPPIEEWNVKSKEETAFKRYLEQDNSYVLEHIYRQKEGSSLLDNAKRIRLGQQPARSSDFDIRYTDKPVDTLIRTLQDYATKSSLFTTIRNQVIVLQHKGWTGTAAVNAKLQRLFMPSDKIDGGLKLPRHSWDTNEVRICVGDKVVCGTNMYDMRNDFDRYDQVVFDGDKGERRYIEPPETFTMLNGEIGIVVDILDDGEVHVDFGDRVVTVPSSYMEFSSKHNNIFPVDPRKELSLAYALTTHKCQGSEFDNVIYVLNRSASFLQSRQNFYTAITRARETVTVITDMYSMTGSVRKVAK